MPRRVWVHLCFLSTFFVAAGTAVAMSFQDEATLEVLVTDSEERPVSAQSVLLSATAGPFRIVGTSGDDGRVRFEKLAPGTYLVSVTGFATSSQIALTAGERYEQVIALVTPSFREAVTVTANGNAEARRDLAKTLSVVSEREITLRNEYSLTEALRTVPGLRVQTLGGPGNFTSVKTRGLRNEDTAVLIDGARFRDVAAPQGDASAFLETLVLTDVESLEILRGSGSSVHGSHSGGGTINIITKRGGGPAQGNIQFEAGGLGLLRANGQVGGGLGADRLSYSLGLSRLNVMDGIDGDDEARNTSVQGQVTARLSPRTRLSGHIYGATARLALNESPEALVSQSGSGGDENGIVTASPLSADALSQFEAGVPLDSLELGSANFIPAANDPDSRRESSFLSTMASLDHQFSSFANVLVRYHGLFTNRSFIDGPLGVSAFEPSETAKSRFDGNSQSVIAQTAIEVNPSHALRLGYELERESYESDSRAGGAPPSSSVDVSQTHQSLFAQDRWTHASQRVSVVGSLRYQFFSLGNPTLTPSENAPFQGIDVSPEGALVGDVATSIRLGERGATKLSAHVGTGYRVPSLFERFGASFSSFGYSVFGDPRLAPERSLAFDVSIEQEIDERIRLGATYFQSELKDVILFDFSGAIDPSTDPFGRFGGYLTGDGTRSRGIEIDVEASLPGSTQLAGSYTFTDAEAPGGTNDTLPRAFVVPEHQFSLVATKVLGRNWTVTADVWASSEHLAPVFNSTSFTSPAFSFEGAVKADIALEYRRAMGSVFVRGFATVENVFDDSYYESGFRTPSRTGRIGLGLAF